MIKLSEERVENFSTARGARAWIKSGNWGEPWVKKVRPVPEDEQWN